MKYFDAFSGIGGFALAAERCGHVCAGFSEIDQYAIRVYSSHFPSHKDYGDITTINIPKLPDFDLLLGGFPCQSFSLAGKRGGFEDTRGTLFFSLAAIAKHKKPSYLLLENVKGLLSHNKGNTFATIVSTLDELGYDLQWQVLNSINFGVPQNRERLFIIGHRREIARPKIFPIVHTESGCSPRAQGKKGSGGGACLTTRNADGSNYRGNYISQDGKIRRLTEIECERLQGFPDDWTEGIPSKQRYKCLGNAVTVNVVQALVSLFPTPHFI